MIMDILARVMDAQDMTTSDEVSDDSYDMGDITPKRRLGGRRLSMVFVVTTAAAGDAGTLTDAFIFKVISSAAAALTTPTTHIERTILAADLVAGYIFEVPIPFDAPTLRYLGAMVDLGGDDTISLDAMIMPQNQVQDWVAYAKGYAV